MIAAKARAYYDKQAKERQTAAGKEYGRGKTGKVVETLPQPNQGKSRDQAGKAVGVGGRTVDKATKVRQQGGNPGERLNRPARFFLTPGRSMI